MDASWMHLRSAWIMADLLEVQAASEFRSNKSSKEHPSLSLADSALQSPWAWSGMVLTLFIAQLSTSAPAHDVLLGQCERMSVFQHATCWCLEEALHDVLQNYSDSFCAHRHGI